MKRSFDPEQPEMMDRPQPVSAELRDDLESLRRLNAFFGSHSLVRKFLGCWMRPGKRYRILDLATGGGDIPRMIVRWARKRGIAVEIDAVDSHPSTLAIARERSVSFPEINYLRGDIRTFEEPLTYDIVCCCLALHHFGEDDAVRVLRRARDLSHDHVLVADLERQILTWASVRLLTLTLFRAEMTRHDARLSARRAFSFAEFRELARRAGWEDFTHRRFLPARQAMWMNLRDEQPVMDLGGLDAVPG